MFLPLATLLQQDADLLLAMDSALADATRRAGKHLVCRPGCTQCCHGAFAINALDALRLRNGLATLQTTDPETAAAIGKRAHDYISTYGADFPGNRETGILDTSPEAQQAFADFADEAPCPALSPATGLCELYECRPMTCRVFGPPVRSVADEEGDSQEEQEGLAVCELCFTEATAEEIAAAEMFPPHEQERELLASLANSSADETIIAYCLALPLSVPPELS
jgi:Fe-S-cluster containining protein